MSLARIALLECLEGTLSPDGNVRKSAEDRIKAMEAMETFGTDLMDIILEINYGAHIRQMASILLRGYVETHWTPDSSKFVVPEASAAVKLALKSRIPVALRDPNSKIRNSVASVISRIAHWEWSEEWPNLFQILVEGLKTNDAVQGSMRVLTELSKEMTNIEAVQISPIILPEMLRVLNDKFNYSPETRSHSVDVFRTTANIILTTTDEDKTALNKYLVPFLEPFLQAFVQCLEDREHSNYCLEKGVVKAITLLIRQCPKKISPYLQFILKPVWNILTSKVDEFRLYASGEVEERDVDGEGEDCGIEGVIFAVFTLIHTMVDKPSMKSLIKGGLTDLIYYIIFYMQVPEARVENWRSSPSIFANDENENQAAYTLRVSGEDLLQLIWAEFPPSESHVSLEHAIGKHLSGPNDWRLQEACLFAVCSIGSRLTIGKQSTNQPDGSNQIYFNVPAFIQNVVFPGLGSTDILLAGRCLVLGSFFCSLLSPEIAREFVKTTTQVIMDTESHLISKILAGKAIKVYLEDAKHNPSLKIALLEFLPGALDSFIHFIVTHPPEFSSDFIEGVVDALYLDGGFTESVCQKVTTLAIAGFLKYNSDPLISQTLLEMVEALCHNPNCVLHVQQRFTPTLISLLNNDKPDLGVQGDACDILAVIVKTSPLPLSPILVNEAFPAVINRLFNTDDNTVLQNGGECLRAFIVASPSQIYDFRDAQGNSGLSHVVKLACRLLDPATSEFSASLVGRLVTTLIVKTGDKLGDQLELLLRAVLSKLQSADTLSVIQNLCMVYAHLMNTQTEAALTFLDSVPGPTGQSALHFVMTEWVSRQQCFFGAFDRKVTCLALSKLLQYGITQNDPRLSQIQVKGDEILEYSDTSRKTRSHGRRTGQLEQWTIIPLLVKIFKLLIHELSTSVYEDYYESESSDEDNEDEEGNGDLFVGDELFEDETDFECDVEIMEHPMYTINLEQYLKDYLIEFSSHVYYSEFLSHLTPIERKVLTVSGIRAN